VPATAVSAHLGNDHPALQCRIRLHHLSQGLVLAHHALAVAAPTAEHMQHMAQRVSVAVPSSPAADHTCKASIQLLGGVQGRDHTYHGA
jgi:hypothetical protein